MFCEMGYVDIFYVLMDKSFICFEMIFYKYRMRNNFFFVYLNYLYIYNLFDLLIYYVYGLRKIII